MAAQIIKFPKVYRPHPPDPDPCPFVPELEPLDDPAWLRWRLREVLRDAIALADVLAAREYEQ